MGGRRPKAATTSILGGAAVECVRGMMPGALVPSSFTRGTRTSLSPMGSARLPEELDLVPMEPQRQRKVLW